MYSSKADYADILIPFIKAGLLNNELCLWIYSQNMSYEQIKEIIGEFINDIDVFLESGQLKLISCLEWYMEDNSFNELRVNKKWNEFIRYALNNGFDGMRAVGDTSWLEKSYFRAFSNYEHNINKIISELPFIVICLYHVDKLDTYEIATIIKNHSYVITRHNNDLQIINNIELLIKDKQLKESEERIDVTPFMKIRELEKDIEKNRELLNNTLEYDQIKTEFFSNISHELKTPLNVILATIQLLKCRRHLATDTYIKESKYLKIMQQNCFRLLRLVNNIIDITKIDSDYFEMKLQNYDIIGLIKRITMSVVEYAKNKGITILFDTNKEAKTVACDPDQIERIILNLLSNAIKFTCRGGNIWVSVYSSRRKIRDYCRRQWYRNTY